jgi:ATP-dependent Clp protease ATP-binding subunit ClpA
VPSFSRNLEETLHRAVAYANQRKHEYATLEHLLLSLAEDPEASAVMRACNVDLAALNTLMLEAKVPYIQPPPRAGGPGGQRPPGEEDIDQDR